MATVSELLAAGKTYSFEFFPPKNDAEQARLVETLLELQPLRPSFVSVTYRGGPPPANARPTSCSPCCA